MQAFGVTAPCGARAGCGAAIFPEYEKLFSKVFGMASIELLSKCTTPEEVLKLSTDNLAALLNEASKKRLGAKRAAAKAQKIQDAAASSFGVKLAADIMAFQVRQELEQIQLMEKHVAALDEEIAALYCKFDCTLETMPGLGPVLAAVVLSEIGDISRFSVPEKLVAYAGINPSVRQSGNFSGNQNRMSKRSSPFLRRAIWLAAFVAAFNDPVFSAFYQKKRAEGKNHMTAIAQSPANTFTPSSPSLSPASLILRFLLSIFLHTRLDFS